MAAISRHLLMLFAQVALTKNTYALKELHTYCLSSR